MIKMKETWGDLSVKDKLQLINGSVLIFAAIILYFLAFLLTMTIGLEIVSAGATLLATGLAFFGITSFVKNQMISFEQRMESQFREYERRNDKSQKMTEEDGEAESS